MGRETLLISTMVELADTLVEDFDVVELFSLLTDRCVELLDVTASGLMLSAPSGELRLAASSSERIRVVELFEIQADEGPCPDCFRTGAPVINADLAASSAWPRFTPMALEAGFRAVHAVPMHLRERTIGALNLFRDEPGQLSGEDVAAAQAFADVATIGILQHQANLNYQSLNAQLNRALESRIVIEQAKGMISERTGVDMDAAFSRLRGHARNHNLLLADVARSIVDGSVPAGTLDVVRPAGRSGSADVDPDDPIEG
jgi:GAF domain-containing protein